MADGAHRTRAVIAALLADAAIAIANVVGVLLIGSGSTLAGSSPVAPTPETS